MRIAKQPSLPSLDNFYAGILEQLRAKGVPGAITGGLACVEFGVTEHTEDCDLICAAENAGTLLQVLEKYEYGGVGCQYRKSSPPLDARWLLGGYTAHFRWPTSDSAKPFLDVFSVPPRVSSPWKIPSTKSIRLNAQHEQRVKIAEQYLPEHPIEDYGIDRVVAEARQATALGLDPIVLQYLPQVKSHFQFPNRIH
jgi:hypothetical protein